MRVLRRCKFLTCGVVVAVAVLFAPAVPAATASRGDAFTCGTLLAFIQQEQAHREQAEWDFNDLVASRPQSDNALQRTHADRLVQLALDTDRAYRSMYAFMAALRCDPLTGQKAARTVPALSTPPSATKRPAPTEPNGTCVETVVTLHLLHKTLDTAMRSVELLKLFEPEERQLAAAVKKYGNLAAARSAANELRASIDRRKADIVAQTAARSTIEAQIAEMYERQGASGCNVEIPVVPTTLSPTTAKSIAAAAASRATTTVKTPTTVAKRDSKRFPGASRAILAIGTPSLSLSSKTIDPAPLLREVACSAGDLEFTVAPDGSLHGDCTRSTRFDAGGRQVGPNEPYASESTWRRTITGNIDFINSRVAIVMDETLTKTPASDEPVRFIAHYDGGANWARVTGATAELQGHVMVLYHCEQGPTSDPIPCSTPGFGGTAPFTMKVS